MHKLILFKPLPDEVTVSYLSRLARVNGYRDPRDICTIFAPRDHHPSFIDFPINFTEISNVAEGFLGEAEALMEVCSWLPLQNRLGEIECSTLMSISSGQTIPTLSELSFVTHSEMKRCRTCIKADQDKYRIAYWHRIHQVPLVKTCHLHETPLEAVKFKRSTLHHGVPLPHEVRGEFTGLISDKLHGTLNELAVTAWQAISCCQKIEGAEVDAVIRDELEAKHYLRKNGSFKEKEFWGDFLAAIVKYYLATPQELKDCRKIRLPVGRRLSHPLPLGRMSLIHYLFGSWEHLLERIKWIRTFGSNGNFTNTSGRAECDPEQLGKLCRDQLVDFVATAPKGDRLAFTRKHYRVFRWLLRHDKAILDQLLPIPKGRRKQLILFETS